MATVAEMQQKTAEIKAENANLCKYPGTGFHDNDPTSPQKKGLPALRDHIVAHQGTWEFTFVGDCAARAVTALKQFAETNAAALADERADADLKACARAAGEYAGAGLTSDGRLVVRAQQYNTVLDALTRAGVGVTAA